MCRFSIVMVEVLVIVVCLLRGRDADTVSILVTIRTSFSSTSMVALHRRTQRDPIHVIPLPTTDPEW